MKLVADMHTHSIASTHAYATITEMAQEAHDLGLFAIAITDHARTMPGAPGPFYFESLAILPAYIKGVRVLHGIEANICDYNGNLDAEPQLQDNLEWVVASLHTLTIEGRQLLKNVHRLTLVLQKILM